MGYIYIVRADWIYIDIYIYIIYIYIYIGGLMGVKYIYIYLSKSCNLQLMDSLSLFHNINHT